MKRWLGWGLLVWGLIGVYDQYTLIPSTSNVSPVSSLTAFDPAEMIGMGTSTSVFSPAMLVDASIAGVGAWLIWG